MATRTTVTLDDDVLKGIKDFSKKRDIPFREALNQLARRGLDIVERPPVIQPFKVTPVAMGYNPDLNYDDTEGLIEYLEGPLHR